MSKTALATQNESSGSIPPRRCQLVVIDGPDAGRAVALAKAPVRVGTREGCALRLSDQGELYRMSAEKALAFGESWSAMAIEALAANQRMALAAMQSFWFPWLPRQSAARQINEAALGVLTKGMAPVRRRAVANAKRLGRGKRRRS